MQALRWIDEYGDLDGDGLVEFQRRSERGIDEPVLEGLVRLPALLGRALRRASDRPGRGAGLRLRREAADGRARARRLARPRARRAARPRRGRAVPQDSTSCSGRRRAAGTTCSPSTHEKAQVDSACSNMGHLLWSGAVPPERVDAVVDALMGPGLWSGWGVRTMAATEAAYNPLSYHNGTVWPHDNSLIAWGLASYARWPETQRIVRRMLDAAALLRLRAARGLRRLARARTPRSRSPTRPRRARRRGRRARPSCCCRCCSACGRTATSRSS